jgi:hypothetical protein
MTLLPPPLNSFRPDSSWLKCGAIAGRSGLYRVHHYAHRAPHTVFIPAGTRLPECRGCGLRVQYAPLIAGETLEADQDLAPGVEAA